jgi:hypothetical protein
MPPSGLGIIERPDSELVISGDEARWLSFLAF